MDEIKTGFPLKKKIKNGSKIVVGKNEAIIVKIDKHFNKFQKIMIKKCFGFEVEDYTEV